jgi:hypothetical protein
MTGIAPVTRNMGPVADVRTCDRCGAKFAPRREHARFCSARCRVAWNRANSYDPAGETSALQWSASAMTEVTSRLPTMTGSDKARALGLIGEAVWLVTIVDASLVRHYPDAYDRVMAAREPAERQVIEDTLAGLRFVRNRIGQDLDVADLVRRGRGEPGDHNGRGSDWTWRSLPEPDLDWLSERGKEWELARYRAYQARLAGHTICETFGCAAAFLRHAAAPVNLPPSDEQARTQRDIQAGLAGQPGCGASC